MQNDFEKNITQRMQEFSINPQPEIWQQVEAALPPEKKRRRIALWWWLLPLAGLLGTGLWIIGGRNRQTFVQQKTTQVSKEKVVHQPMAITRNKIPQQKPVITLADTATRNSFTYQKNSQHKERIAAARPVKKDAISTTNVMAVTIQKHSQKSVVEKRKNVVVNSRKAKKQVDFIISRTGSENSSSAGIAANKVNTNKPLSQPAQTDVMLAGSTFSADNDSLPGLLKTDTTAPAPLAKLTPITPPDTTKPLADTAAIKEIRYAKKIIAAIKQPTVWMVDAGLGVSGLYQSVNSNKNYLRAQYTSANPITGGSVANSAFISPQTSFNFSLGINRKQIITSHWNWQLGLRYQLLSAIQSHGSQLPADSFITSSLSFDRLATTLYNYGAALKYHNYVHQLQIIPRIEYQLNPAGKLPVYLNAGFSIGYTVLSNQLLYNYTNRNYARSAKYTTRLLYAIELGAGMFIHKKIYAGLTYQQGLSNVAKPALQSDFRWRVWQVQLRLPLFNHLSK